MGAIHGGFVCGGVALSLLLMFFSCSVTQTSCAADFNFTRRYNGIRSCLCWHNEKCFMNGLWQRCTFIVTREAMKLTTDHITFQLVCTMTGILLLAFADEGGDSTIRSYLHYLLILYLTWVFHFHMGCSVEAKAAVRATHESAVMSCFGGFLSAVSARCHHWRHVLTQGSNDSFNTCPQASGHSFQYTAYLCWLTLCIIGLKGDLGI